MLTMNTAKSTQVEYYLVDVNPDTQRATCLLDQEKVVQQWEKSAASQSDPSVASLPGAQVQFTD